MAYYMYLDKVLFPITPGKINTKINGKNETLTLINEGEVNRIKSPGLTEIEIEELLLPTLQEYPFANYQDENGEGEKFHSAQYYLDGLEKWKKERKPIQWKMIRTTPDCSGVLWDSNMDVTIEDYEIIEDVKEYGFDVCVKLSMKQYKYFGAKELIVKKKLTQKIVVEKKKTREKTKARAKTYTVKKGDTLRGIAKKQLNNVGKWKDIYKLNKKTIQSVAKKRGKPGNGLWIFPGTKLKLPK